MRRRELSVRAVGAPAFRQQAIVLERAIQADKAGRDLSLRISNQLLVNLNLALVADDFVMRLKNLLACHRIVEEFRRQHFVANSFDDRANAIRAS